jgi:hypothetical protein
MLKIGMTISDTYRNENGISLQMSSIAHAMGEEDGIAHVSNMFREVIQIFQDDREKFQSTFDYSQHYVPIDSYRR